MPFPLVDINALSPQIRSRQINLLHEFCVCLWDVVECEDTVAEFEQKVGAEGDKTPEGKLKT